MPFTISESVKLYVENRILDALHTLLFKAHVGFGQVLKAEFRFQTRLVDGA